jgi:hypothetical protein
MQYMNHEIFQPCKWPLIIDPFLSMSNASCFYTKQLSRGTQRPVNDQLPHGLKNYYHHELTNLQMATTTLVWNICWAFINASATDSTSTFSIYQNFKFFWNSFWIIWKLSWKYSCNIRGWWSMFQPLSKILKQICLVCSNKKNLYTWPAYAILLTLFLSF